MFSLVLLIQILLKLIEFYRIDLQGTVRNPGTAQIHEALAREAAGDVAGGALSRGGKAARPTLR